MSITISVALATFNGEAHVREQLNSLAAQDRLPDQLVVSDDCSDDNTLVIVQEFAAHAPFPVEIFKNKSRLGFADNFCKAAKLCTSDWISFCDQDDYWLPNKLYDLEVALARNPNALVVLQNARLGDSKLNHDGNFFPNKLRPGFYEANAQYGFWVWQGFLISVDARVFSQLSSAIRPLNYFGRGVPQSHDKWVCMIANALGCLVVLGGATAIFRRHSNVLTGGYAPKSFFSKLRQSMIVGADHYAYLHKVALSCADYLEIEARASGVSDWRFRLRCSASKFRRLGDSQAIRARLYCDKSWRRRSIAYFRMIIDGYYFGDPFFALGWRSALKDFCVFAVGAQWFRGRCS